jgi:voltage-gated potassium channel
VQTKYSGCSGRVLHRNEGILNEHVFLLTSGWCYEPLQTFREKGENPLLHDGYEVEGGKSPIFPLPLHNHRVAMDLSGTMHTENNMTTSAARTLTGYDLVIVLLAIFSLLLLIPLLFVPLSPPTEATLSLLENGLGIVFLFDFFRSLHRAPKKWAYFLKGGGWLDLLGSLPVNRLAIFRIARLFRLIFVMRKLRTNDFKAIILGRLAQNTLLFTLAVALPLIFIISGIVLYAEQGVPDANIHTYPEAVWWAVVTLTTVGYGNYYPVTILGQSMAVILMFFGIGIIGVLSSYLATTFITIEERRGGKKAEEKGKDEGDIARYEAELATVREELAALRQLLEERLPD